MPVPNISPSAATPARKPAFKYSGISVHVTSESVFTCRPESVFTCRPEYASNDSTVPVAQSETLDEALKAVGADAELHIVQGAGHGFGSPSSAWPDAEATIFEFLRERGIAE